MAIAINVGIGFVAGFAVGLVLLAKWQGLIIGAAMQKLIEQGYLKK